MQRISCSLNGDDHQVSIPVGFSGSLQRFPPSSSINSPFCFNPCRVFWFVATSHKADTGGNVLVFQSLSGFLVRCNPSIASEEPCLMAAFQSLSGFLVRCNISEIILFPLAKYGFNPCRVFWFVATRRELYTGSNLRSFNPCRVFWFVATLCHIRKPFI